ncbi:hypothetical protein [Yoonia tamlensis]|uniref:hypothetical protein n=1 Tax=Yoonia tamlensis TaxID=390270 RepID=UPI001041F015|nr:hypothetical protein [Yoonia tamlensis]
MLPFLGIGALILSLFSILPFVGWLVPGMVSIWLSIAGIRCALFARGHTQPIAAGTVFTICLYYSVIFLVVGVLVNLFMAALIWIITLAGFTINPLGLFAGVFGVSPVWSALLIGFLAPVAITTAAFAVPMTAAAASTGRGGWDYRAFAGFGRGAISLSFVMAVWMFSGHLFSFFGEIWTFLGLMVGAVMALSAGENIPFQTDFAPWTALRGTLIMAWASSWYFATAVLTWEDYVAQTAVQRAAQHAPPKVSTDDIRALRQARMQKKR